jgi:hypothetical protein
MPVRDAVALARLAAFLDVWVVFLTAALPSAAALLLAGARLAPMPRYAALDALGAAAAAALPIPLIAEMIHDPPPC